MSIWIINQLFAQNTLAYGVNLKHLVLIISPLSVVFSNQSFKIFMFTNLHTFIKF